MLIKDHIEEHAAGSAEMEVVNYDGNVESTRSHLYKPLGSGAGGDIHAKETEYDAGMPVKGQPAFPKGVDMPEKLRQLESRQELYWGMCKPEKWGDLHMLPGAQACPCCA